MLRNKPIRRHGTTPMGLSVCAAMMGDSSKPIRRHGTTPMSFSVCAAMMGDSSSVAWKPGSGSRDGCSRTSRSDDGAFRKGAGLFKWELPSGAVSSVQTMGEIESSQVHSSRVRVILYIIAV